MLITLTLVSLAAFAFDRDVFAHVQYTYVRGHDVRAGDDTADELGFDRVPVI